MIINSVVTNIQTGGDAVVSYCPTANSKPSIQLPSGYWFYTGQNYAHGIIRDTNNQDIIFNPSTAETDFRIIAKIKCRTAPPSNQYHKIVISNTGKYVPYINVNPNLSITFACVNSNGNAPEYVTPENSITTNDWYYLVLYYNKQNAKLYGSVYDKNATLIQRTEGAVPSLYNNTSYKTTIGGRAANYDHFLGDIDLTELYFEIDGTAVWGETNSKTATLGIPT